MSDLNENVFTSRVSWGFSEISAPDYSPLTIKGKDDTIIFRIDSNGKIFWNGREVESDEEFRKTMINLTNYLSTLVYKG
jgi:hypothetical protein